MTPERYRQIGELYHAVMEVDSEERAAFLERACAGDEGLRREVESLVNAHEQASDFIDAPALEVAAGLLADGEADALRGKTVSHYKIVSLIGVGGMGRVYLAEDTQLGRRVALKFLPEYFTHDKNQVQRFRQEARAASALNHPNILTVYEVGQVEGTEFMATEYVEGETLRARLSRGALSRREALEVAVQVADALTAAHQAGIVHRDVKPENVMLRGDGYVKVLDFGLAKLTENLAGPGPSGGNAVTIPDVRTNPGVVMGTPDYMSPEQARGLTVDARADVWSLGVVLYEMVAGRRPFGSATHSDTIVSILEREPPPVPQCTPEAPAELERIVMKALTKNTEERYQTAKDMAIDLRRVKRRLEVDAEMEGSVAPEASRSDSAAIAGGQSAVASAQEPTAPRTTQVGTTATTSSIEYLVSEVKRHKGSAVLVGALLVIALAGLGYSIYSIIGKNQSVAKPAPPFQTTKITRLTSDGKAYDAAISPDGKYVVYAIDDSGRQSLWVRQVATATDVRITLPSDIEYSGMTFSPDNNYVYYVTNERSGEGAVYQVPVIGGTARKLLMGILGPVTFSPDGKYFAFVRGGQGGTTLMKVNADGSGEEKLAFRRSPNTFWPMPAWSPDGKIIACSARSSVESFHFEVVGVRVDDRVEKLISQQEWFWVDYLAWVSDSSGLLMIAIDHPAAETQVWHVPYPDGEARKITNDLNSYHGLSLTAASNTLVTIQSADVCNIWTAPRVDASRATQLTSGVGRYDGSEGVSWTPDDKILFRSWAKGTNDVWIMERDGSNSKQLMVDAGNSSGLSVSPDGRYIALGSRRAGVLEIWRTDIDGGNPKQLTGGGGGSKFSPFFSPDGKWVVYTFLSDRGPTMWKIAIDGSASVQLSDRRARSQAVSPDGKLIACSYFGDQLSSWGGLSMAVVPIEGGPPAKILDVRLKPFTRWRSFGSLDTIRWTPNGSALTYIDTRGGVSNIWSQPLNGGKPAQLTNFTTDRIFNFDWSRDGKWLALARGSMTNDVVLISDLR